MKPAIGETTPTTKDFAHATAVHLHRVTYMMDKLGERVLQDKHSLTLSQFFLLMQMTEQRVCQRELADALSVTPAAISRHVAVLMKRGYLERLPHESDRRYGYVALTPAGRTAFHNAEKSLNAFFTDKYSQLSAREKAEIGRSLNRLMDCFGCENK